MGIDGSMVEDFFKAIKYIIIGLIIAVVVLLGTTITFGVMLFRK